jgi:RNA-binding protein
MPIALTPRERAGLKARAHGLEPLVQVGQAGLTDAGIAEVDQALTAHELIKVRVGVADRRERDELCQALSARTDSALVQRVGKVLVLWRPRPEEGTDVPTSRP